MVRTGEIALISILGFGCPGLLGAQLCTDTDYGNKPFIQGQVTDALGTVFLDQCEGGTVLQEGTCSASGLLETVEVTCEFGCFNGAGVCFTAGDVCSDSDYGLVPSVRGLVEDKPGKQRWDRCRDSTTLVERTCGSDGILENNHLFCPFGCDDSADRCDLPPSACTDSDAGIDPFTRGLVISALPGVPQRWDRCSDPWHLIERVCAEDGGLQNVELRCPQGCDDPGDVCFASEPGTLLPEEEFWDNGLGQICFYSAGIPELSHTEECEQGATPSSRYWQIAFASGGGGSSCRDLVLGDPTPGPHVFAQPLVDGGGNLEGLLLVQDYLATPHPCGDTTFDWLILQAPVRQGHPQYPDPRNLVTRVRLRPSNDVDESADGSGTRYLVGIKGRKTLAGETKQFVLSVQYHRDKLGNAGYFSLPCVVTARECRPPDACASDPSLPGEILHLYGSCFDAWIDLDEERELRIDWGEILAYAVTLERDGEPVFTSFDEISITALRIGFELTPGEGKRRRSELEIRDLTVYSTERQEP